jgi:hypothetical protein
MIDAEALQLQQQEIITKKLAGGNAGQQFGGQFGGQKKNFIGMTRSLYRTKRILPMLLKFILHEWRKSLWKVLNKSNYWS